MLGVALHIALAAVFLDGGAVLESRFEYERPAMGLPVRMVLYAPSEEAANVAADSAYERIEELNGILSDYNSESELLRLCRTATADNAVAVSEDLWRVLVRAREVSEATGGAFDVTAGPIIQLWRQTRALNRLPTPERLAGAMARSGYRHLLLDSSTRSVRLDTPNMRLDLGGIAKGYVVGEALKTLRAHGIRSALIDTGGDMAVGEAPPGEPGWRIALAGFEGARPDVYLSVSNAAVSTSGDRWQFVEIDGVRYSHIVDPRSGQALTGRKSVTVVGRDPMTTDAWATSLNVLGPEEASRILADRPSLGAYCLYERDDHIASVETVGWKALRQRGIVRPLERPGTE
jgi:FAD:protein FMN transferase